MGSFYGLEIAKTGLFISQRAINVTGHNIANTNTEGYTRQRLVTESIDPGALDGRFGLGQKGVVGGGVQVQVLDQLRSDFLDREFRRENASSGYWETRTEEIAFIDSLFNEMSETGIAQALSDFYDSLHELTKDPVSEEIRTNVLQNGIKMTETFNHYYNQLVSLQRTENKQMDVVVNEINDHITNIAAYNKQIYSYELSGEKANDLRDKRNVLLDELSRLVNIEYDENSDSHLVVTVEGQELVNHTTTTYLETQPIINDLITGETGLYQIFLETGPVFNYSSGELKARKDIRDGSTESDIGIPRIIDRLNTLARSISEEFNAIHETGYTMPFGGAPSTDEIRFFEVALVAGVPDYTDVTAENFSLSTEVLDNVFNIAASDTEIDLGLPNNQQGNNIIALELVELTSRTDIPVVSNFENYLRSTVIEVAMESAHSEKLAEGQSFVTTNMDDRRQSITGVSIDEEMINMVRYQHSYTASSRILTAIDEALEVLINRTGTVGR